jgi:hypothetical protein
MTAQDKPSASDQKAVKKIGKPVTSEEIDEFGKLKDIHERSRHHRTIINAWKQQQDQDRKMRKMYATWLMVAMSGQIAGIYVIFILIGFGFLEYQQWTMNTFIMSVFAEVGAMVLLVVKYLFPSTSDKVLDLIDRFRTKEPR